MAVTRERQDGVSEYDVIVVGGGPAGATAAYYLGQNGIDTLLIDRSRFPRDKPCGGGISTRVLPRFPYLREVLAGIPVHWVSRIHLESPSGFAAQYASDSPLYLMIRRYEFDNMLFELAKRRVTVLQDSLVVSLEIAPRSVVVSTKNGNRYSCKILIGADGANSIVAKLAGLRSGPKRSNYAIDMMEETSYDRLAVERRDTMYVFYGAQRHFGYSYVFPKTSHINLGAGYKLDYYLTRLGVGHRDHYDRVFKRLEDAGVVSGRPDPANFMAFPIPIAGPLPRTHCDRVLLSGDAGGFVNAFTAEGIYYAMVSGELAARAAVRALETGDCSGAVLGYFEVLWKSEIGQELVKSVEIQKRLFSDPSRIDRIVKAAAKNRRLAALLAEYATGAMDYRTFRGAAIRLALPLYLREKIRQVLGTTKLPAVL